MTDRTVLDSETLIGDIRICAKSWLYDTMPMNFLFIEQGRFKFSTRLNEDETTNVIKLLEQHLVNIKENETELIAISVKAAA